MAAAVRAQRSRVSEFGSFVKLFLEHLSSDDYSMKPGTHRSLWRRHSNMQSLRKVGWRYGDDMTTSMAWVAFIRCMAVIGWSSQGRVDVMIPVSSVWREDSWMGHVRYPHSEQTSDKSWVNCAVCYWWTRSGILSARWYQRSRNRCWKVEVEGRPYITLVMELGVTLPRQSKGTDRHVKEISKTSKTYWHPRA